MKAISCDVIIGSVATRSDNSIGIRLSTPELKPEEKTAFFELQGAELKMLLQPKGIAEVELKEVKKELGYKTPSQRLRAVLFVEFKQKSLDEPFEQYYLTEMERIIEFRKSQLEPQ